MVRIAGCWDVWQNANEEFLVHWRFMIQHFGVTQIHMTPIKSDLVEEFLFQSESMDDIISLNEGYTPIIVDENGSTPLSEFVHPERALYIFGRVGWSPKDVYPEIPSIRIPSWAIDPNLSLGMLHSHQAASIVLYDRMTK
jgi:hypothetical protein